MGGGHGSKESEATEFHWHHEDGYWEPEFPFAYSEDIICMCQNYTETNITDACYEQGDFEEYNLGLHIMAIFIILCMFIPCLTRFSSLRYN